VEIETTQKVISTCTVLLSARLNMSKVTEDRLEDRSSQWEATKRSVGHSTTMVVVAHREIHLNDGEQRLYNISSA